MRKYIAVAAVMLAATLSGIGPFAAAPADPSMHQIYEAAEAGRLPQAQQMIEEVLRDHPASAKAHYVQAELFARAGKIASARAELGRAEQLAPGLPFAKPKAVQELRAELSLAGRARGEQGAAGFESAATAPHIPWGTVLIAALGAGALWMFFRRRAATPSYATVASPAGGLGGGAGYGSGPMAGGGFGSGLGSSLATGLAVGAGVVAGEELAHHLLDGRRESTVLPPSHDDRDVRDANSDMGGNDFGINDTSSWDDGGSSGGGDDWG
jgi:hypothetical protein